MRVVLAAIGSRGDVVPFTHLATRLASSGHDVTLITHQTSKLVQDAWVDAIKPGCHISTLTELADMVSASIPVNFAIWRTRITTDHLVLLGIGMEMRATALLYSR